MSREQLTRLDPGYQASVGALLGALAFVGADEHKEDQGRGHPLGEVGTEPV